MEMMVLSSPIFTEDMMLYAYRFASKKCDDLLSFRAVTNLSRDAVNPKMLELIEQIGLNALTNDYPIFISMNPITLMADFKLNVPVEKVIINIDQSVTPEDMYLEKISQLKQKGYRFALNLGSNYEGYKVLALLMDYIVIDKAIVNKKQAIAFMEVLRKEASHIKFIATNVNGYHMFNLSKMTGYNLFQGRFYRIPVILGERADSPLKTLSLKLINVVNKENFELEEVSAIVLKDPMLSVSLLRYINSQNFGQKINSISHAVALLGQKEVIRWVNVSSTTSLANDKPAAVSKLALIRAKFAENLAPVFRLPEESYSMFLMGLFSVLDVILNTDIKTALDDLSIKDEIYDALVLSEGPYSTLYNFILAYEAGDWSEIARFSVLQNIKPELAAKAYVDTLNWYKETLAILESNEQ
ncbi:MAG: HDOD domain-containing protein [Defluviitaleaceae bacterium]|nr:HDOD domain-containing protein [Defluviitaleaceae bacterium]